MRKHLILLVLFFLSAVAAPGAIQEVVVDYQLEGVMLEGFLAFDDSTPTPRPGVLVVHEWTGLGDFVKDRCRQLAGMGYVALGADIYGKGVRPASPEAAGKEAAKYKNDRRLLRSRILAALGELLKSPLVEPKKIAAIGFCFGGTTVLELARSGAEIAGVVSFHGGLSTPEPQDAVRIKAKVLVLHGADDPHVPAAEVAGFQEEMRAGKVDWQMVVFGNAVHSFTNTGAGTDPSRGAAYHEPSDRRSWEAMKGFFQELFTGRP